LRPPAPFAAGDLTNAWQPFFARRIHVEHCANAINQGPAAAQSMLGQEACYDRLP
jgi:3-phenylpropionate/trans-cinnamate dioxygenase ferredoxin reductase subunit